MSMQILNTAVNYGNEMAVLLVLAMLLVFVTAWFLMTVEKQYIAKVLNAIGIALLASAIYSFSSIGSSMTQCEVVTNGDILEDALTSSPP
ncbi:MAG: hypothetical protein GW882_09925 [Thiomicrospira sp.]|nr:hypothetical protein [Thiomicrospira sp.]NCN66603.1 hypothetical protein [Thiomicrospira sp.]NCO82460.1 hypothetical protein [Thiomicrospira sp.]